MMKRSWRAFLLVAASLLLLLDDGQSFLPSATTVRLIGRVYTVVDDEYFLLPRCDTTTVSDDEMECNHHDDDRRRKLLSLIGSVVSAAATWMGDLKPAEAARSTFLVTAKNSTSALSFREDPVNVETDALLLSSELCLLKLLPIKNPVFRTLEGYMESLSSLRSVVAADQSSLEGNKAADKAWKVANQKMQAALSTLDSKRAKLEPVFNQDDSTLLQISKGERGERLIGSFRDNIVALIESTKARNATMTFIKQKEALLALADIGELLVASFPFDVPNEGKFSVLPRLLGRCRVTFSLKRGTTLLGNVTIMADGFAAPITAGNFVDLSVRQFYTGLPIKSVKKNLGGSPSSFLPSTFLGIDSMLDDRLLGIETPEAKEDSVTVTLPILGSFQEGFYDPLTAKPRRLPLEVIRSSKLSYARGFSDLSSEASIELSKNNQPLLSFDIPSLVAMNHPDNNVNGASSEFFSLLSSTLPPEKRRILDGNYAPFGYIIDGYELYQSLKAGDIIDSTEVGEWGILNLVKKNPSFSNVIQGEEE